MKHRGVTYTDADYRPVIAGDGFTAGHVRRRYAAARELWQYRAVGSPDWIDAASETDAEARCFRKTEARP